MRREGQLRAAGWRVGRTARVAAMLLLSLVFLLNPTPTRASFVEMDQDGGYSGVVIALSPKLTQETGGVEMIEDLKDLFRNTSALLFAASGKQVFFKEVSILVPPKWNLSGLSSASFETYSEASVRVGAQVHPHDDTPFTEQARGCGKRGNFIHVTPSFVSVKWRREPAVAARMLLQNWARYRYGVFEERGVENSNLYPTEYVDGEGAPMKTGCSHPYPWRSNKTECPSRRYQRCHVFQRDPEIQVMSSLMDDPKLGATHFCNSNTHNREAPTMHNALCRHKSVGEVIRSHRDFSGTPFTRDRDFLPSLSFTVVKATSWVKTVVVIDPQLCTLETPMASILSSLVTRHLMDRLPAGASFATLMAILDDLDSDASVVVVDRATASTADVFSLLCNRYNVTARAARDFEGAIWKSDRFLRERFGVEQGGDVIVLADGRAPDLEELLFPHLRHASRVRRLRSSVITYPPVMTTMTTTADRLGLGRMGDDDGASGDGVAWFNIGGLRSRNPRRSTCDLAAMKTLNEALATIGRKTELDFYPKQILSYSGFPNGLSRADFVLNSGGRVVFSVHRCGTRTSNACPELEVDGTIEGTMTHSLVAEGVCVLTIAHLKKGRHSYKLRKETRPSYVAITEESGTTGDTITVDVEVEPIYLDTSRENGDAVFILRALVHQQNGSPVRMASVVAVLDDVGGRRTRYQLLDNGNDPDNFAHDGIYSRYLLTSKPGVYSVTVRAAAGRVSSRSVQNQHHRNHTLPFITRSGLVDSSGFAADEYGASASTGSFAVADKPKSSSSLHAAESLSSPPRDVLPPNRITDFRAERVAANDESLIRLVWTAPGGDFDQGRAYRYELKCDPTRESVVSADEFDKLPAAPLRMRYPLEAGSVEKYDWTMKVTTAAAASKADEEKNGTDSKADVVAVVYCAIRAADRASNKGEISNVATIATVVSGGADLSNRSASAERVAMSVITAARAEALTKDGKYISARDRQSGLLLESLTNARYLVLATLATLLLLLFVVVLLVLAIVCYVKSAYDRQDSGDRARAARKRNREEYDSGSPPPPERPFADQVHTPPSSRSAVPESMSPPSPPPRPVTADRSSSQQSTVPPTPKPSMQIVPPTPPARQSSQQAVFMQAPKQTQQAVPPTPNQQSSQAVSPPAPRTNLVPPPPAAAAQPTANPVRPSAPVVSPTPVRPNSVPPTPGATPVRRPVSQPPTAPPTGPTTPRSGDTPTFSPTPKESTASVNPTRDRKPSSENQPQHSRTVKQ